MKTFSLHRKLAFRSSLIGLLVMAASSLLFYGTIRSINRKAVYESLSFQLGEMEQNIENGLRAIDNTAKNIIQSQSVKEYLFGDTSLSTLSDYDLAILKNDMAKDISRQLYFNPAIQSGFLTSISLCLDEENIITQNVSGTIDGNTVVTLYLSSLATADKTMSIHSLFSESKEIFFVYPLTVFGSGKETVTLIIAASRQFLTQKYQTLLTPYEHASYALSGPSGVSLASSLFPRKGKKYETQHTLLDGQFASTISIPEKQLTRSIDKPLLRYMLLFLAVLLSIVLVSYLFASRITLFSNDFSKHLRKVGEGDFSVTFPPYGDEDIDRIGRTFNIMTGEINELVEGVYKKQLLIQQMEIRHLQSQMNPHFLFNVLFSISVKAKEDGDEPLYQMVHSLTVLLKGSLSTKEENEVTIAEEKEYVEAYLKIQEIRFGERLSHSFSIPEGILGYLCPRLSLEPLVENAVIHGIEPLSRPGHVTVSGTVSGDTLRLSVIDDGEGFDPSLPGGVSEGKSNHIALSNLKERIRLLYGPAYGLTVDSAPNKGCRATIILPIRERRIS